MCRQQKRLFRVLVEEGLKIHININHNAQCHSPKAFWESFFEQDSGLPNAFGIAGMTDRETDFIHWL